MPSGRVPDWRQVVIVGGAGGVVLTLVVELTVAVGGETELLLDWLTRG
jgi:hypothetical protein